MERGVRREMTCGNVAAALSEQLSSLAEELAKTELVVTSQRASTSAKSGSTAAETDGSSKKQTLTRMELVQIILSLQEIQNIQMDRLQALVEQDDGAKENTNPHQVIDKESLITVSAKAPSKNQNIDQPRHWSLGRPLETLVESEQETDGKTTNENTPRSSNMPITDTSSSNDPITTPASFQADVSALATTEPKKNLSSWSMTQRRNSLQSRASQECDEHTMTQGQAPQAVNCFSESNTPNKEFHRSERKDSYADDTTTDDSSEPCDNALDDSALYCPTIIASERKKQQRQQRLIHLYGASSRIPLPSTPHQCHLRHIDITLESSPAVTALTMDTSLVGSSYWNNNSLEEDQTSIASEETPILDRYRIDHDERLPRGFVVVPNQRGMRRGKAKDCKSHCKTQTTVTINPTHFSKSDCPSSKHVFRKTPYRAAKLMMPTTPTIDENMPLNEQASCGQNLLDQYDLDEESLLLSPACSMEQQNVNEEDNHTSADKLLNAKIPCNDNLLRVSELDFASPKLESSRRHQSLPTLVTYKNSYNESATTDQDCVSVTEAFQPRHPAMTNVTGLLNSPERSSKDRRFSALAQTFYNSRRILSISEEEYSTAPRIIQMQVTMDDVEASVRLLNESLDLGLITWRFSENRVKALLKPLGVSQRKCKAIMMSLCHWQRLLMRRQSQVGGNANAVDHLGLFFEIA